MPLALLGGLAAGVGTSLAGAGVATAIGVGVGVTALSALSRAEVKKAENKALSLAEEQEVRARNEAREREGIILDATKLTPEELEREKRALELEERRLPTLEKRAGMTGEELLASVGPTTRNLLEDVAAEQGLTGEELFTREGAIPQALQEQVLAEIKDPGAFFEDTLEQQLELVRQEVNKEAQRRGVFGGLPEGGIRFEQLGRAGVELAIGSARERQTARQQALANASALSTQFANLKTAATGRGAQVGTAALGEQERARAELAQFLQDIQNLSTGARGRAGAGAVSAQQVGAGITVPARTARTDITGQVLGGQIQRGLEGERAGLEFAGGLLGEGIIGERPPVTPTTTGRFELPEQFFEEDPLERIASRVGRLPLSAGIR